MNNEVELTIDLEKLVQDKLIRALDRLETAFSEVEQAMLYAKATQKAVAQMIEEAKRSWKKK